MSAGRPKLPEFLESHWGLWAALLSLPFLGGAAGARGGWLVLLAGIMASYDLTSRRIPNPLTALAALAGIAWGLEQGGLGGGLSALLGGLFGFGLMAVFFFLGAVGGGDVKALGALGTFVGPWGALDLFILTTLAGGVLALGRILVNRGLGYKTLFHLRLIPTGLTLPYGLAVLAASVVKAGGLR